MSLKTYCEAWWAIIVRLLYLARYGRADIQLFTSILHLGLAGMPGWKSAIPGDFAVWLRRVDRQLALERKLPKGTRLGTFRYSPVSRLKLLIDGNDARFNWQAFEAKLRKRSGVASKADTKMRSIAGYAVSDYVTLLRAEASVDPVAVHLLLAKEIELCAEHWSCKRKFSDYFDLTTLSQQRRQLLLSAMAFADHERLLAICQGVWSGRHLDHKGLRDCLLDQEAGHSHSVNGYSPYVDTAIFSVPALFTVAKLGYHHPIAKLREVLRVLSPIGKTIGGSNARRPLIHYYGLETLDLLALGTVEILTTMAALQRWSTTRRGVMRVCKVDNHAVGVAGLLVDEIVMANRWPVRQWDQARRPIAKIRRSYLNATADLGGGAGSIRSSG